MCSEVCRLIIVNNPVTSLFFRLWLERIKSSDKKRNIVLYEPRKLPKNYCEDPDGFESEHKKHCLDLFINDYEIFELPEIYYHFHNSSEFLTSYKAIKTEILRNINKIDSSSIKNIEFDEIWFGNTMWQQYFKNFRRESKLVQFDHGLTEMNSFIAGKDSNKLKNFFRSYFHLAINFIYRFPIFNTQKFDHISILANETNYFRDNEKSTQINSTSFEKSFFRELKTHNPCSNVAVILLENIKPWAKSTSDHKQFFMEFENMLISNELIFKKHNVDCIVFKAKHWHHEFSKELINMFEKLKTKYRLEFFSDNNLNTSIEYYLKSRNIKLVMGNLSSALFFAKKINPSIATYSFDEWFVNYTMKKFNNTWEDIPQMRLWYYDLYEPFFQEINPLSLSFALNIDTK